MNVEIVAIPEDSYQGRQYGYELIVTGGPQDETSFRVWFGGTGPCWNIGEDPQTVEPPEDAGSIHVCDLDELIAALGALRASDVFRENFKRWGIVPPEDPEADQ